MDTFADYILEEEDLASKMEIVYYLSKKNRIFFNKSVVFKTEITRMFLDYSKIEVDRNLVLTAALLCNVKKIDNAQDIESVHAYAKKGAEYLRGIGFNKRFCKICEEVNRYSNSNPREKESDILELVDKFGGMLLDRPERLGYNPEDALVLLEHRNLKDEYNRYMETFMEFVRFMENVKVSEIINMTALKRLIKIYNETDGIIKFIKEVVYNYEPKVDKLMEKQKQKISKEMFDNESNPNRPLFSKATVEKIMNHLSEEKKIEE